MGEESTEKRSNDTLAMLDYGFNMYSIKKIVDKGDSLGLVKVNMGELENVDVVATKEITVLNNSQQKERNVTYDIDVNTLVAPVKVGDKVGKISVYEDGKYLYDVDLTVAYDIKKANIFKVLARNMRDIIGFNI